MRPLESGAILVENRSLTGVVRKGSAVRVTLCGARRTYSQPQAAVCCLTASQRASAMSRAVTAMLPKR